MVAVTYYTDVIAYNNTHLVSYSFGGWKSKIPFTWPKPWCWQGRALPVGAGGESVFLPFLLLGLYSLHSLAYGPYHHLQDQQCSIFSSLSVLSSHCFLLYSQTSLAFLL